MSKPTVRVIVDLQYGSTGKGLIAGYLAEKWPCDTVVAAWRPNAGHTYIDREGRKFVHTMLPNGIVSPILERIMIGPQSAINPAALAQEIVNAAATLEIDTEELISKLFIHEHAAIVTDEHRERERKFVRVGSTMKGSAEAIIDKMRRDPGGRATAGQHPTALGYKLKDRVVTVRQYNAEMDKGQKIQAEGAQGFSLGIDQQFFPYTTSRECTVTQVLSDCAIPRANMEVIGIGTVRTYPIRVANRYIDECVTCHHKKDHVKHAAFASNGAFTVGLDDHPFIATQVGTSGPCYPDQEEITFQSINQPVELTTVTKLPRRLFTFSLKQFKDALRANGPELLFLNFMNYLPEEAWTSTLVSLSHVANKYGSRIAWYSDGPAAGNVKEWAV
jgi:adenylosuccinate synthase